MFRYGYGVPHSERVELIFNLHDSLVHPSQLYMMRAQTAWDGVSMTGTEGREGCLRESYRQAEQAYRHNLRCGWML